MKFGYVINSLDDESMDVSYFRDGYPETKVNIEFDDTPIREDNIRRMIVANAPRKFWQRIDAKREGTADDLQHLVGQPFTHDPNESEPPRRRDRDDES